MPHKKKRFFLVFTLQFLVLSVSKKNPFCSYKKRCCEINNYKLSATLTCRNNAFNILYNQIDNPKLTSLKTLRDLRDQLGSQRVSYVDWNNIYLESGDWEDLNCDMRRQREGRKESGTSKGKCILQSIFQDGSGVTLVQGKARTARKTRYGDEKTTGVPFEYVCPISSSNRRNPVKSVRIHGSEDTGIQFIELNECYNFNFTGLAASSTKPELTNPGIKFEPYGYDEDWEFECEGQGNYLPFISKITIWLSKNRRTNKNKRGKGILKIQFHCSDNIQKSSSKVFGNDFVDPEGGVLTNTRSCAPLNSLFGVFQFTKEKSQFEDGYGYEGLLNTGMWCAPVVCPYGFVSDYFSTGGYGCRLTHCSCPNGTPKDYNFHNTEPYFKIEPDDIDRNSLCSQDDQIKCGRCDFGFELKNDVCIMIETGQCQNGAVARSCAYDDLRSASYCLLDNSLQITEFTDQCSIVQAQLGRDITCVRKDESGEACSSCQSGFKLVLKQTQDEIALGDSRKRALCLNIDECKEGGGDSFCETQGNQECFDTFGSFSCTLICNNATSDLLVDVDPDQSGNQSICVCKNNFYKDSPNERDQVMGIKKDDFCMTCLNLKGNEDPLCSGHGKCTESPVLYTRPICKCDSNFGGTGCEIALIQTLTCSSILQFECSIDPSLIEEVYLQPSLLLQHGWRCVTKESSSSEYLPANVRLDVESIAFSKVRLYNDKKERIPSYQFCMLAYLYASLFDIDGIGTTDSIQQSYKKWASKSILSRVTWNQQTQFTTMVSDDFQPPIAVNLIDPDSYSWALEPEGLCPFPFNTDIYRGETLGEYVYAPCSPPAEEAEALGWYFEAQGVPGAVNSTVSCFLLDASARGRNLTEVIGLQYRCIGYLFDVDAQPHSALDCLIMSPVAVNIIANQTTVVQRGLWIKEQC